MSKKDSNTVNVSNWHSDKYQTVLVQRNILASFAFGSAVAVLIAIMFVRQVTRSKSLEPYVIELESKTGIPTVVEDVDISRFNSDLTLKRYFVNMFVKSVEAYNPATYKLDYQRARLLSSGVVFKRIRRRIGINNPKSTVAIMGRKGMLIFKLKSIQFLDPNTAQVRYRLITRGRSRGIPATSDMVSYIEFKFADLELSTTDRFINPLGFQVTSYSITDEFVSK